MNRKGIVDVVATYVACGMVAVMAVAAVALTDGHRTRKAMEVCLDQHNDQEYCASYVGGLTKAEKLEYIRDDEDGPGNLGYLGHK